jgi:hypothetical protein|tara:strand:- start:58 stop:333 length:276 start_codon:yes stop_codon:yes gene_type:complete
MTELHEGAIQSAIRVLVDNCVSHVDDLTYKVTHLISDPDTVAEMHQDIEELTNAINYLKESGMVADRKSAYSEEFLKKMRDKSTNPWSTSR